VQTVLTRRRDLFGIDELDEAVTKGEAVHGAEPERQLLHFPQTELVAVKAQAGVDVLDDDADVDGILGGLHAQRRFSRGGFDSECNVCGLGQSPRGYGYGGSRRVVASSSR